MARIRTHTHIVLKKSFFPPKTQLKYVIPLRYNNLQENKLTTMEIRPNDCASLWKSLGRK